MMALIVEPDTTYHSHPAFSKSKLWKYYTLTPYSAEFSPSQRKPQFDVGHAAHTAILEPELLDSLVIKGPEDRRGNKWSLPYAEAEADGKTLLTESDYDLVMMIRDVAETVPEVRLMRPGAIIERSCYAKDEETGADIKCRPDLYNPRLKGMLDIKNLADISDDAWSRDIGKWGYNMQDAMYRDVWRQGTGDDVDFFFFVCFSKTLPVEVVCRELVAIDVEEGFAAYRQALKIAQECREKQEWPSYQRGVVGGVKMRDRDRRFTPPQWNKETETDD